MVTAAHCLYDGSNQLTVKGGAKFRVMVGEHDHCKHNEVRISSKSKTNQQTLQNNKQQIINKKTTNKRWLESKTTVSTTS